MTARWICPHCHFPLLLTERQFTCANGHSYDLAKQGYVNLLLANQKRSKEPGDDKQMIVARRDFLQSAAYAPLANALGGLVSDRLARAARLLDAGCAHGYYLGHLQDYLQQKGIECQGQGIDISKVAVQLAAKAHPELAFAVASTFAMPLPDASVDLLLQVFAPVSEQEARRVIKPGGYWLQANPAQGHLRAFKQHIYQQDKAYSSPAQQLSGFVLADKQQLAFTVEFSCPQQALNLLQMTPFYWSASEAQKSAISQLTSVDAVFDLQLWQKRRESQHA